MKCLPMETINVHSCSSKGNFESECRSNSNCDTTLNLYCIDKRCKCLEFSDWKHGKCSLKDTIKDVLYQHKCTKYCPNELGLICLKGKCQCRKGYEWKYDRCSVIIDPYLKKHNAACSIVNICNFKLGLKCIKGRCKCPPGTCFVEGVCAVIDEEEEPSDSSAMHGKLLGEICATNECCDSKSKLRCINGKCACEENMQWRNGMCRKPKIDTDCLSCRNLCRTQEDCDTSIGLRCINGVCKCSDPFVWFGTGCVDITDAVVRGAIIKRRHPCIQHKMCTAIHPTLRCIRKVCSCMPNQIFKGNKCIPSS